jgi:hypothetical protein
VGFLSFPFHILCASFSLQTVTKFWCQGQMILFNKKNFMVFFDFVISFSSTFMILVHNIYFLLSLILSLQVMGIFVNCASFLFKWKKRFSKFLKFWNFWKTEENTHRVGENICQLYIRQRTDNQNIQGT